MRIEIYSIHHPDEGTAERLRRIEILLGHLTQKTEPIMATIEALKEAVQRNSNAEASVITLLQGISAQLKDAQLTNDPTAIQAIIDQLDANTNAAAAAVVANTPVAGPLVVPEEEVDPSAADNPTVPTGKPPEPVTENET